MASKAELQSALLALNNARESICSEVCAIQRSPTQLSNQSLSEKKKLIDKIRDLNNISIEQGNRAVESTLVPSSSVSFKYEYRLKSRLQDFHFWQKNYASVLGRTVTNNGCTAGAYMTGRSLIDPDFKLTNDNYVKAIRGIGVDSTGALFKDLAKFAGDHDYEDRIFYPDSSISNREIAKAFIREKLMAGRPILARVTTKGNTEDNYIITSTGVYDIHGRPQVNGAYSHAVTIAGLKETADGLGSIITYIDPMIKDPEKAVKTVSYTDFLNSMKEPFFEYFGM